MKEFSTCSIGASWTVVVAPARIYRRGGALPAQRGAVWMSPASDEATHEEEASEDVCEPNALA